MNDEQAMKIIDGLDVLGTVCHQASVDNGWWTDKEGNHMRENPYALATKLFLVVGEVVEAMEGLRVDKMDDHLTYRKSVEVELADVLIRLMDYVRATNLDIGGALLDKMAYNAERADHKVENRRAKGGKKF